jgi:YidC/Oxa1 family membrane protein insertase
MEEKKTDVNSLIGFFLIFLILMYVMYTNQKEQEQKLKAKKQTEQVENKPTPKKAEIATEAIKIANDTNQSVQLEQLKTQYGAFAFSAINTDEKGETILENEVIKMTISHKGGFVKELELKKFESIRKGSGNNVKLIKDNNAKFNLALKTTDNRLLNTSDLIFEPSLSKQNGNQILSLKLKSAQDKYLEYVYVLKPNEYMLDFAIKTQGLSQTLDTKDPIALSWDMKTYRNEKSVSYENRYTEIWFEYDGEKTDYVGQGKDASDAAEKSGFISYKQQFFSSILIADTKFEKAEFLSKNLVDDEAIDTIFTKQFSSKIPLAFKTGEINQNLNWYFGPTDYEILKNYNKNIEESVWFGWGIFGWINKWVFVPIFKFLTGFLPYGLAIIFLTIIVRIILAPLTYKSYLSQAKMKVIRPEIQEVNEKFKNDGMKKQQETMKLYSKAGVNPMAGCLPAFLQIPVFYALFSFFPVAIALRQQNFLWAEDLSSYDTILDLPFYIPFYGNHVSLFPILASVAIFFYMKMTTGDQAMATPPQEGMPDMAKIMKIMIYVSPIMMLIFFNNYSSGLSLYYFVSNTLTIGIMYVIKNYIIDEEKIHAQIQENKAKPKKMNKFQQRLQDMMEQAEAQKKANKK